MRTISRRSTAPPICRRFNWRMFDQRDVVLLPGEGHPDPAPAARGLVHAEDTGMAERRGLRIDREQGRMDSRVWVGRNAQLALVQLN